MKKGTPRRAPASHLRPASVEELGTGLALVPIQGSAVKQLLPRMRARPRVSAIAAKRPPPPAQVPQQERPTSGEPPTPAQEPIPEPADAPLKRAPRPTRGWRRRRKILPCNHFHLTWIRRVGCSTTAGPSTKICQSQGSSRAPIRTERLFCGPPCSPIPIEPYGRITPPFP